MDASTWHGGATRELAAFVAGTKYADVPHAARDRIKALILDTLGVTIAGAGERAPRIVAELVRRYGGPPLSTVIGMPFRTDPASAAWINGTSAHALDYDDVSFAASAHPSVCLVPAILALADEERCSGAQVICAYAVGFEAAVLVGRTINPDHYAHGWHGTGTVGALAATFAAANLLGLTEREVIGAIGIAVSKRLRRPTEFRHRRQTVSCGQLGPRRGHRGAPRPAWHGRSRRDPRRKAGFLQRVWASAGPRTSPPAGAARRSLGRARTGYHDQGLPVMRVHPHCRGDDPGTARRGTARRRRRPDRGNAPSDHGRQSELSACPGPAWKRSSAFSTA